MLRALLVGAALLYSNVAAAEEPPPPAPPPEDEPHHRWHLEAALFPMLLEQQIEGTNRDDRLTQDATLAAAVTFGFAPLEWFEPALWVQFDVGRVRRAVFSRPDDLGMTREEQLVEGAFWEMWIAFLARGRLGPGFVEAGWAPLILRHDDVRSDLPNDKGDTDGVFEGSRAVAFILAGGASIPVLDNLDITLRLQFRIRYLVSRGGEPLDDDEETGQMAIYPFAGAHYHF